MQSHYQINPHAHFKVWFSKNARVPLGIENELRLIRLRMRNPQAKISLLYSSKILSPSAQQKLKDFCCKQKIELVDFDCELPGQLLHELDSEMYQLALAEITKTINKSGGNLAAASDMVRLIVPALINYGIYTDLDAEFDCSTLPSSLNIKTPVLLSINRNLSMQAYNYRYEFGNEFIACTNTDEGIDFIRELQKIVIANYKRNTTEIKSEINSYSGVKYDKEQCIINFYFNAHPRANLFEFRTFIANLNFLELYRAMTPALRESLFGTDIDEGELSNDRLERCYNEGLKKNKNVKNAKDCLHSIQHNLLIAAVIMFSGPNILIQAFKNTFMKQHNTTTIDSIDDVLDFAYKHSFKSNHIDFSLREATHKPIKRFGITHEMSWTGLGEYHKLFRQFRMEKAAISIQRFFRHHLTKSTKSIDEKNDHQEKYQHKHRRKHRSR